MPAESDWRVPEAQRPRAADVAYDLETALRAVVSISSKIPDDAFTAEALGTERAGSGVLIRDGVVLTIGYLVTEAEQVWLTCHDGRVIPGHVLGIDFVTGFGLVQALGVVDADPLRIGRSATVGVGSAAVLAGAGGRLGALATRVVARQPFAGYWEYALDEAIFTAPAHPHWGGTALIGPDGSLVGIGSLQLAGSKPGGAVEPLNMSVPIDLLGPILPDMLASGSTRRAPRPWLGAYFADLGDEVYIMGLSTGGPADRAGIARGDRLRAIGGEAVTDLGSFYRRLWSAGPVGVRVTLTLEREGDVFDVAVKTGDRARALKGPKLH